MAPHCDLQNRLENRRHTHDYVHRGTSTLFAALDIANGKVFTECKPRHRHQEFLSFLHLDQSVAAKYDHHLIVDSYATFKDFHLYIDLMGPWMSTAPDNSVMLVRDTSSTEIYPLDVDFP